MNHPSPSSLLSDVPACFVSGPGCRYYRLRGFGDKPRFIYEIRCMEAMMLMESHALSDSAVTADVLDTDYM